MTRRGLGDFCFGQRLAPKFDGVEFAGLIDQFYEAAVQPDLWRGLLARTADAVGAAGCGLLGGPTSGFEPICSASMDEALDFGIRGGWLDKNPRLTRGLKAFEQGHDIVTESMLFTAWELDHLPFNAEFVNRVKGRWFADMLMAGEGPSGIVLTLQRLAGTEPFSASEIETMRRLAPHIRRAGQLALRLADMRHEGLFDALAAFDCGALVLDRNGRVTRLNDKAEALMTSGLAIRFGMLAALDKGSDAALQGLIRSVIARGSWHEAEPIGPVAVARPNARPLVVHAAPLTRSARDLFQRAVAVLMLVDPDAQRGPFEPILCQAFRFTSAEAAIAADLCRGRDVEEITRMRGVSTATVRAQMKALFAKTDTKRQAELVALLARYSPVVR